MVATRALLLIVFGCFIGRLESKRSTVFESALMTTQDGAGVTKDGIEVVVMTDKIPMVPESYLKSFIDDLMTSLREKTGLEIISTTPNKTVDMSGKEIVITDKWNYYLLPALQTCSYEFSQSGSKMSKRLCLVIARGSFKCKAKDAEPMSEEQSKLCTEKPAECTEFAACADHLDTFKKTESAEDFGFVVAFDNVNIPHMQERLADAEFDKFLANSMDCQVGKKEEHSKTKYNVDACAKFIVDDDPESLAAKVESSVQKVIVNEEVTTTATKNEATKNEAGTTTTPSDKSSASSTATWLRFLCAIAIYSMACNL